MKCPSCGGNHKKSAGMRCACGYRFVLHPTEDGLADGAFLAIVRRASQDSTYCFTENQLYSVYCSWWKGMSTGRRFICGLIAAGVCVVSALVSGDWQSFVPILSGGIAAVFFLQAIYSAVAWPPSRSRFQRTLRKWTMERGPLEKMITVPQLEQPLPEYKEPDIFDYGVERVMVVERDLLVDLLVLNEWHADTHALVISANGYPRAMLPQATHVLGDSPQLPVFLLHDAAPTAMNISDQVRRLIDEHPVVDLGLSMQDAKKLNALRAHMSRGSDQVVPVDLLPFHRLSAMLSHAVTTGIPIASLLNQSDSTGVVVGDFG
jgi:hypothetical protein